MCAYLLSYCPYHPNPSVRYYTSTINFVNHVNASYFSVSNNKGTLLPPDPSSVTPARPDSAIYVMSQAMRQVLASPAKAEVGATFYGSQDAVLLRKCLIDLEHSQDATLIITDNVCADRILNNTIKQNRSKAMDMRFYWVRCRIAQGQFRLLWRAGE